MKDELFSKLKSFSLSRDQIKMIVGGICQCQAAAPYSCEAGGYTVGTVGFRECMTDIWKISLK